MPETSTLHLSHEDLMAIRDAVPGLDLLGIRSLSRAGYRIVKETDASAHPTPRQHASGIEGYHG